MDKKYFRSNAVYQIWPRSFCDSNGDGIGDLNGIASKLDYLADLGIGIIWLSPVYRSPNFDYGYDISDYLSINPEFGTLADMDSLIAEAKKRGIRIVMDLVVNHTSSEHRWFVLSKQKDSPYHAFYYWRVGKNGNSEPPNNWTSNFGGSAWTFVPEVGEWYLHLFAPEQPDLDWHNPEVIREVERILRFWLDRGIYGFRCDVINQIWKESLDDGKKKAYVTGQEHYLMKEGNHKILQTLNKDVFSQYDCMTVGETYDVDLLNARRFTDHELDMVFQFEHMNIDKFVLPIFDKKYHPRKLKECLFKWQKGLDWNANYLENHDQTRSIERFGDAGKHWRESGKMLATVLLTLRGTPYIYMGEELGMLDMKPIFTPDEYKDGVDHYVYDTLRKFHFPAKLALKLVHNCNRDNARTPMQWDASKEAGFTTGTPWIKVNPNYEKINAKAEEADPESIRSFYKRLLALRKKDPCLTYGSFEPICTSGRIMAYYRSYEGAMDLIVMNLSGRKVRLPKALYTEKASVLLSNYKGAALAFKKHLRAYESFVCKIH
ncbi:MAG: alpha-glucosidase [Bacilli bacterium]|jgi:oligo-1,6-glucosidase|nr:alpha-glucosidase [Bacilli bacterium]